MTENVRQYIALTELLLKIRADALKSEEAEEELLAQMDDCWWALSKEEQVEYVKCRMKK